MKLKFFFHNFQAANVTKLFLKMLLQLNGMTLEKAYAISEIYPSPASLKTAYTKITSSKGERLLANLTFGKYNKMIGVVLSKIIYNLFTLEEF